VMKRFHELVTTLDSLTASGSHRAQQKFSKQQGGQRRQNITTLKRILNIVSGGDQAAMLDELNSYFVGPESHEAMTKRHQHCLEMIRDEFIAASQNEKIKILSFVAKSYPAKFLRELGFEFPLSLYQNAKRWSPQSGSNGSQIENSSEGPNQRTNQDEEEEEDTNEQGMQQRQLPTDPNQQQQRPIPNHEMVQNQQAFQQRPMGNYDMMQNQGSQQRPIGNYDMMQNQGAHPNQRGMPNQGTLPQDYGNYQRIMAAVTSGHMPYPNHVDMQNQRPVGHQGMNPNQRMTGNEQQLPDEDQPKSNKKSTPKKKDTEGSKTKKTKSSTPKKKKEKTQNLNEMSDQPKKSAKRKRDSYDNTNQISFHL
jgi:hypothetical protein